MERAQKNAWVVIAAYREAPIIRSVVEGLFSYVERVVVVDDHSRDATGDEAYAGGADVLTHPINRGQGASLRTGTQYALAKGADMIVHFDADGQHLASDIPQFLDALAGGADVALGSRFMKDSNAIPPLRRFVLRCGILFTWLFSGIKLSDTHNGFRAFTRRAASQIIIRENRMAHASEILHEIVRLRLSYSEVPTTILYTVYSKSRGQSSWNSFSILWRIIWRKLFLS